MSNAMVEAEVQRRNKLKKVLDLEVHALSQQHDQVSWSATR